MSNSLVSVCIPNFNNARYLKSCIESALAQTYANVEIIFSDDCSSDESLSIANQYKDKIKVIENKINMGQPRNTNLCIDASSGDYIVILHSDDELLPNFCEKLVPILDSHENVGLAVGERLETDEEGNIRKVKPFYNCNCIVPGEKQAKVFMFASYLPCQVLVRKSVLKKIGKIDERHIVNLDGLLWFTCSLHSDLAYIQDEVAIYRIHGESTTAQYNRTIDHMLEFYETLKQMFKLGKGNSYLEEYKSAAIKRVGALSVRYAKDILREKNFDLIKRYLSLAMVFDPEIVNDEDFKQLNNCVQCDVDKRIMMANELLNAPKRKREFSYDPPVGFISLNPGGRI